MSPKIGGILLLLYGAFIGWKFAPVAAGSDAAGYMNAARMLAGGELSIPLRQIAEFAPESAWPYTPLGFVAESSTQRLRPTYPLGLPLHYALASSVCGWKAGPTLVTVLAAVGLVLLTYCLARDLGVSAAMAIAGAGVLGASPVLLYVSSIPFSDALAAFWCTAAIVCALRAPKHLGWAAAAGAACSLAVLVRPTNVLLIPFVAVLLLQWRSLIVAAFGGLPGAALMAFLNYHLYGGVLRTGYGSIGVHFSSAHVLPSLRNYLEFFPLVLPLAFVAVAALPFLNWRTHGRVLPALAGWVLALAGLYCFYEFTAKQWWYLRFLLPAFPAIVVLALLGMERFQARPRTRLVPAALIVVSLALCWYGWRRDRIGNLGRNQNTYSTVCLWARENLPANAAVCAMEASSALYYYTDFPVVRWDWMDETNRSLLKDGIARSNRPLFAIFFLSEEEAALKLLPGKWTQIESFKFFRVWRYEGTP
jgi:hypothetical protein